MFVDNLDLVWQSNIAQIVAMYIASELRIRDDGLKEAFIRNKDTAKIMQHFRMLTDEIVDVG
jgi:hypothetical protein